MTTLLAWIGGIFLAVCVIVGIIFALLSGMKPGDVP